MTVKKRMSRDAREFGEQRSVVCSGRVWRARIWNRENLRELKAMNFLDGRAREKGNKNNAKSILDGCPTVDSVSSRDVGEEMLRYQRNECLNMKPVAWDSSKI
jgi:hypothetical protein